MKKNIFLVGALALALAACGNGADKATDDAAADKPAEEATTEKLVQQQLQVMVETSNLL